MLNGIWGFLTEPGMQISAGFFIFLALVAQGYHKGGNGKLARRRCGSVFVLSIATYTFLVCVVSQLVVGGPRVSELISKGFGDERVAWIYFGVVLDGAFRVWSEFSETNENLN